MLHGKFDSAKCTNHEYEISAAKTESVNKI